MTTLAFVCVHNAGRSQMAAAFAERECAKHGRNDVTILTGGTEPADSVHDVVVEAMAERGIDIADRTPRAIQPNELANADAVFTMGCEAADVCPAGYGGDYEDWALQDPGGAALGTVREIRDDIERRVLSVFEQRGLTD